MRSRIDSAASIMKQKHVAGSAKYAHDEAQRSRYIQAQLNRHISPLRYPGGKRAFAPFLRTTILASGLQGCRYLEPYAGGAGAALELLRCGVVSDIIINDKDPAIYWFWKAATEESDRLVTWINSVDVTIQQWINQREILLSRKRGFELGASALFLNRTCVSGVIKRCGGPIGGYEQKGNYKIDCRFDKDTLIEKIRFLAYNRQRIKIHNMDALKFLSHYSEEKDSSFFYLDPPYYHKASELYLNAYNHSDHEDLRNYLFGEFYNHNWVLSYDYCPETLQLYRHQPHSEVKKYHALANKAGTKELITFSNRIRFQP